MVDQYHKEQLRLIGQRNPKIVNTFKQLFFNDKSEKVQKWHNLFKDPVFFQKHNLTLDQQRDLAYKRLKKVADAKLFSIFDFDSDPMNILTCHEMLGYVDSSLATKFTVQFNLFGGTLMALHTERHLGFMRQVDSLKHMGCFCLTELGYGNNAVEMETTVTYDETTQQFIVNSPSVLSQKYWITNGACHSNYAVVCGQTIVKAKNEGVNFFIVRIRDDNMNTCDGVFIEDMGMKMGLNGVDNGRLMFNNVRIPRENMLNKLCDVSKEGVFKSDIEKRSQRFFKVTDRLLSGRLCISAMCLGGTKIVLAHTIKYSQQRLAVGPNGKSNTPIMAYQLQQNSLVPLLARTVVLNLMYNASKYLFANPKGREFEQIKVFCATKCLVTWNYGETSTICRERCGGGGFLSYNRVCGGIEGAHSGMTAEGDNRVLMQKVVKDIISDMQRGRHKMPDMTKCPKRQIPQMDSVSDLETLTNLIYYKENVLIEEFTKMMQKKIMQEGQNFFEVWMYQVSDEIQNLAQAYGERIALESALGSLSQVHCPQSRDALQKIIRLHALCVIRNNLGWYMIRDVIIKKSASVNLEEEFQRLVREVVPFINDIVDGFNLPKIPQLWAPIARNLTQFNQQEDMDNVDAAGDIFEYQPKL